MPPKKRGRKPKKKEPVVKGPPKKRGRKPKGGKIIKNDKYKNKKEEQNKPNIILHLKCNTEDLNKLTTMDYNPELKYPESFNINSAKTQSLKFNEIIQIKQNQTNKQLIHNNIKDNTIHNVSQNTNNNDNYIKEIWNKLYNLKNNLRINNVSDKKSACFWCTYSFDNPAIYIPSHLRNNNYEVYGCFCSPQCAVAYLKKENIDDSTRWERYALINNIYGSIYKYKKNIKPAPSPFYTLDKYYGNLEISEYRKLLENDTILMIVNKPMTKITPELYEENNEIPNIFENLVDVKESNVKKNSFRLGRKYNENSKTTIVNNNFNLS
jgi:hypothetical protein